MLRDLRRVHELFRTGDEITSGPFTGTVEAIETRATLIRTYDGERVIIPNSLIVWDLAGSTVNIRLRWWTKPDRATVVRLRGRILEQIRERFPAAGIDLSSTPDGRQRASLRVGASDRRRSPPFDRGEEAGPQSARNGAANTHPASRGHEK